MKLFVTYAVQHTLGSQVHGVIDGWMAKDISSFVVFKLFLKIPLPGLGTQ